MKVPDSNPAQPEGLSAAKQKLLEQRLKGRIGSTLKDQGGLKRRPENTPRLASVGQERIWLLNQIHPSSPNYNISSSFVLEGEPVQKSALQASVNAVITRHESLRSNFTMGKEGLVQTVRETLEIPIQVVDVADSVSVEDALQPFARTPFELETDPLIRAYLGQKDDRSLLMLVVHDILFDKWSLGVFWREVSAFYKAAVEGSEGCLAPLPVQYSDFAHWQRTALLSGAFDRNLSYWKTQLADPPAPLPFPTDRPYPRTLTDHGRLQRARLSPVTAAAVRALAASEGVSVFTLLLYGFKLLLNYYTGKEDILVGTPVANRRHKETTQLIGFFLSTVCIRTDLTGNPRLIDGLRRLKETAWEAIEHQDAPLDRIVDAIKPDRVEGRHPLFQTMFVYQREEEAAPPLELGETIARHVFIETGCSKFDLSLFVAEAGEGMETILEYRTDLFDPGTMSRMLRHYEILLDNLTEDPYMNLSQLEISDAAEKRCLLDTWQGRKVPLDNPLPVPGRVALQAERNPGNLAVVFGESRLSYESLMEKADKLARQLLREGLQQGQIVGLFLPRSADAIVAILGILRAGGAYLPVDPEYPGKRIRYLLSDAEARVIVTGAEYEKRLPSLPGTRIICMDSLPVESGEPVDLPDINRDAVAYSIYTSGSTGKPKGVLVTHENLMFSTEARFLEYPQRPDTFLLIPSLAFDSSIAGTFWTLCSGGTLVIPEKAQLRDPESLCQLIGQEVVSMVLCVPSYYRELLSWDEQRLQSLEVVIVAGETCHPDLVGQHFKKLPDCELYNEYGPTEATVWSTFHHCVPEDGERGSIPIGRPVANVEIHLFDTLGRLLPPGVCGEIWIGGKGVARGYCRRDDLTRERFQDRSGFGRLYRTGDLGKWDAQGHLQYNGREDEQVKVRGYRIELGEIETVLRQWPQVREAAVVVGSRGDAGDSATGRIMAFLVMKNPEDTDDLESLRQSLSRQLPGYMLPSSLDVLKELPRTPHGKVDRAALRRRIAPGAPSVDGPDAPELQPSPEGAHKSATLLGIFREALGKPDLGSTEDFFGAGGDSILAIQVISRALRAGIRISVTQLFASPSVDQLLAQADPEPMTVHLPASSAGPVPLTPIQCWFLGREDFGKDQWNHSVLLELKPGIDSSTTERCLRMLLEAHDALRLAVFRTPAGWMQRVPPGEAPFSLGLFGDGEDNKVSDQNSIEEIATNLHASMRLDSGCMLRGAWINSGQDRNPLLLLVVHHMAVDGISWQVILQDLDILFKQSLDQQPLAVPDGGASFKQWAESLVAYSESPELTREQDFWEGQAYTECASLPTSLNDAGPNNEESADNCVIEWDVDETGKLLESVSAHGKSVQDLLLAGLAGSLADWIGKRHILIEVEGHGREEAVGSLDLTRTVGWFTSLFPVVLEIDPNCSPSELVDSVSARLDSIPIKGIGFGVRKYLSRNGAGLREIPEPQVTFNYLGRRDAWPEAKTLKPVQWFLGNDRNPKSGRPAVFEVNAVVSDGKLVVNWSYSMNLHERATVERLVDGLKHRVNAFVSGNSIDGDNEAVFPLTASQSALLLHHLQAGSRDSGLLNLRIKMGGCLDRQVLEQAWQYLVDRHLVLRTSVQWKDRGWPVQVVSREGACQITFEDLSNCDEETAGSRISERLAAERSNGLDLGRAPVMRLHLFRLPSGSHVLIWTCHHILLDGWSSLLLLDRLVSVYRQLRNGESPELTVDSGFVRYQSWVARQSLEKAALFWKTVCADFGAAPLLLNPFEVGTSKDERVVERMFEPSILNDTSLGALARRYQVTRSTLITGTWAIILGEILDSHQVVVGTTFSGRSAPISGIDSMAGMFANTLPLFFRIDPADSITTWYRKVFSKQQACQEFEYCSLQQIHDWTGLPATKPLFDTLLIYANQPWKQHGEDSHHGLFIEDLEGGITSAYPLTIAVQPGNPAKLVVRSLSSLMESGLADFLYRRFTELLEAATVNRDLTVGDLLQDTPPELQIPTVSAVGESGVSASYVPPTDEIEQRVQGVWESVFERKRISIDTDFFELGGNSLLAAILVTRLEALLKRSVSFDLLYRATTIRSVSRLLREGSPQEEQLMIPLRTSGHKTPLVFMHSLGGEIHMYRNMLHHLPEDRPIYAIRAPDNTCSDVDAMTDRYLEALLEVIPDGSCLLAGYCFGGLLALDMSRKLQRLGMDQNRIIVIDFMFPDLVRYRPAYIYRILREESFPRLASRVVSQVRLLLGRVGRLLKEPKEGMGPRREDYFDLPEVPQAVREKVDTHFRAVSSYRPGTYNGDIFLIASESDYTRRDMQLGWDRVVTGKVAVTLVGADHNQLIEEPHLSEVAAFVCRACEADSAGISS